MKTSDLTHVQAAVLEALTVGSDPHLIHYSLECPKPVRGRGQVRWSRHRMEGQMVPSYLVRKLIKGGYIELDLSMTSKRNCEHYIITESGRKAVTEAQKGSRSTATGHHPSTKGTK